MAFEDCCCPIIGDFYVLSPHGERIHPVTKKRKVHKGIDINDRRRNGTIPVHAIADGVVRYVDPEGKTNAGCYISIWHDNKGQIPGMPASEKRFYTNYFHLKQGTLINVEKGDEIKKGQQLGIVGQTGRVTGPHLHFEIRKQNKKSIDPFPFIESYSEVKSGRYRTGINPQTSQGSNVEASPQQETTNQPTAARPTPETKKSPKVPPEEKKKEDNKKEKEIVQLSDDEIKASTIGFYLPQLIQERPKNDNDSIIHLKTDSTTSYIQNLVFAKGYKKDSDFSLLSTLDLSSLVPFVELYSLKKGSGGTQNHRLYPFDDYSSQVKIDSIFADKTGRGGNVGIESVDWKTVATNPSNVNQIMVSVKIRIQDIQDIETPRNGVTILDFLYPGGSSNNTEYRAKSFNVKLKVGWLYKRQQNNPDFMDLDKKIGEKLLSDSILATLHKHSFEFESDGSVLLSLDYYGMLETELSDPYEFDVLEKLNPKAIKSKKRKQAADFLLNAIKKGNWTKSTFQIIKDDPQKFASVGIRARSVPENPKTTDEVTNYIDFGNNTIAIGKAKYNINGTWDQSLVLDAVTDDNWDSALVEYIEDLEDVTEEELEASFLDGIANLLQTLSLQNKVHYLRLNKEQVELLKNISETTQKQEILDSSEYSSLVNKLKQARLNTESKQIGSLNQAERITELLNTGEDGTWTQTVDFFKGVLNSTAKFVSGNELADRQLLQESYKGDALKRVGGKFTLDSKEFEKAILREVVREPGQISLSYVYLGDILNYYMNLFFEEKNALQNKDLRLVLGTFSYRDMGELTQDSANKGSGLARSSMILKTKDGVPYQKVSAIKKYANLSDIPISMESLLNWYNTNVLDSSLERMSLNKFINSLFRTIVPANLGNGILNYGPKRSIIPGINYISTYAGKDSAVEKEIREAPSRRVSSGPKFEIDMTSKNYKNSAFFKLRNKAEIKDVDKKFVPVANYLFITSLSESDKNLRSSYESDSERGIYHFYVGEDKGLVREIKFTREDNNKLDAANLVKANKNDTDNMIIRQVYNCNLSLFGNTVFYPGQLIYVNPTYPGTRLKNKTLYKIGLGGYFQIIKISNFIEPGGFETRLETKWLADGQGFSGTEGFLRVEPKSESQPTNAPLVIGVK